MLRKQLQNDWRGTCGLVAGLILAAFFFWNAIPDAAVSRTATNPASVSDPDSSHATKPIEEIRVGERVVTDLPVEARQADRTRLIPWRDQSPESGLTSANDTSVDPMTWRLVRMRAETTWDDGTIDDINVETLLPARWLAQHHVAVGKLVPIPLDLVEMGLPENLQAKVLAIERCPPIESGPGQVVLTTVNHLNRYLFDLTIADEHGRSETVGVTGFHKFYSADRCKWVAAVNLRRGECLDGLTQSVCVVSRAQRRNAERVYNLTVEGEHVYRVATRGVLVHNNCPNVRLFRAIAPAELDDVLRYGDYGVNPHASGKYFFTTEADMREFAAAQMLNKGPPLTLTSAEIPAGYMDYADNVHALGEGPAVHFSDEIMLEIYEDMTSLPAIIDAAPNIPIINPTP